MRFCRCDRINEVLSDELILEIFRRVDSKSSRGAISLVSRRWFNLVRLSHRFDHLDSLDAVCDICGNIGVAELILTCSKCKISCEHAYCRKVLTQNYCDDWLCDNCNMDKKDLCENEKREKCVTLASESPGFERGESTCFALRGKHHLKERFINKGKVKSISTQEAIRLCSGSRKGETVKHHDSSGVRIDSHMCSETVVDENDAPFKSPVTPVSLSNSKLARVKPVETKLAIPGKEMDKPSDALSARSLEKQLLPPVSCVKPATETTMASSGKKIQRPSEASSAYSLEKQFRPPASSVAVGPSVETRAARKRKEASATNEATLAPTLTHLKMPRTSFKAAMKTKEASTGKEASHQVESDKFSRGPAHASSWRGQFKFLDDMLWSTKFENVAHTCSITSRKVLEFSRRMPHHLEFKLIKRNEVWMDLFQDGCANEDDIGLYFYSGEEDRSSGYDLVLALIGRQDLALRCELNGVVLYLFTSKILSADYQTWDGHHYLWGVLHKIKKQKDVTELYKEQLPQKV